MSDYLEYHKAVGTPEGSVVGNYLLRQLMEAMGESTHARPQTPREVWDEMLTKVRSLGKADWLYDDEMGMHIPCCTRHVARGPEGHLSFGKCGNGPLTGDAILTGDCGEHGPLGPE